MVGPVAVGGIAFLFFACAPVGWASDSRALGLGDLSVDQMVGA